MVSAVGSATTILPNPSAKSEVWQHFGFPGSKQHYYYQEFVLYALKRCRTRIILYSHLEHHHMKEYRKLRKDDTAGCKSQQTTIFESIEKSTPLPRSSSRRKQLVEATAVFIVEDLRPVAVVDGKGFTKQMKAAEPRFTIPSRTFFLTSQICRSTEEGGGIIEYCTVLLNYY